MSAEYVALTGSKNNAGDFLIKRRAFDLFAAYRPDRSIHDVDGWKPLDSPTLDRINRSRALLLLGGPALHRDMHPKVYPLVEDLDRITVPIIGVGLGWQHRRGSWEDARTFRYSKATLALLDKIDRSGYAWSVRDFSTLRTLEANGLRNALMTGCPATYEANGLTDFNYVAPRRVGFSLGVGFVHSRSMLAQTRDILLRTRDFFRGCSFEVAFHHSLNPERFHAAYKGWQRHLDAHSEMAAWLESESIAFRDISGGADTLIDFYADADLHVGYRVHAHIYMASLSRPTLLVAEDSRGRALGRTLGGMVLASSSRASGSRLVWAASRHTSLIDAHRADLAIWPQIQALLEYEVRSRGQHTSLVCGSVRANFETMRLFLKQLP